MKNTAFKPKGPNFPLKKMNIFTSRLTKSKCLFHLLFTQTLGFTRSCSPSDNINGSPDSRTTKYQKHIPSGFCYYVVCTDPRYSKGPELYSPRDFRYADDDDDEE